MANETQEIKMRRNYQNGEGASNELKRDQIYDVGSKLAKELIGKGFATAEFKKD